MIHQTISFRDFQKKNLKGDFPLTLIIFFLFAGMCHYIWGFEDYNVLRKLPKLTGPILRLSGAAIMFRKQPLIEGFKILLFWLVFYLYRMQIFILSKAFEELSIVVLSAR